jgi:hypothetical protein
VQLLFRNAFNVEDAAVVNFQQEQHVAVNLVFRRHLELGDDVELMLDRALAGVKADRNGDIGLHFCARHALLGHHVFERHVAHMLRQHRHLDLRRAAIFLGHPTHS